MLMNYFERVVEELRVEFEADQNDMTIDTTAKHPTIDCPFGGDEIVASIAFDPYNQEFYYWAFFVTAGDGGEEISAKVPLRCYDDIVTHIANRLGM